MRTNAYRSEKSASGLALETIEGVYAENVYSDALITALGNEETTLIRTPSTYTPKIGDRRITVTSVSLELLW